MKLARSTLAALAAIFLVAAPAGAGPIVEAFPKANGEVNWTQGAMQASGAGVRPANAETPAQARLLARQAAIADAYRNLAVLMSQVHVSANSKVERYTTDNDTVRLSVEAYIRDARPIQEQELPDGTYVVTLGIGMVGKDALTGILLPGILQAPQPQAPPAVTFTQQPAAVTPAPQPDRVQAPQELGAPPPVALTPAELNLEADLLTKADAAGPFTGLIIDARGLNVQPAMSPRIYDGSGKEVYGTVHVNLEAAEEMGVAGYMGTIKSGLGVTRVGKNPLVIRATGTPDEFHRYVAISDADAQRVLAANGDAHFLEKCAVILVVDERRLRDDK